VVVKWLHLPVCDSAWCGDDVASRTDSHKYLTRQFLSEQVKYRWTDLFLTGVDYTTERTNAINNTNSFD